MKRKTVFLTAAALMTLLTACLARTDRGKGGLRLWFAAPAEEQSREVTAPLASCGYAGAESVPALLDALLAGPGADSGLINPIPAGTGIVGWSLEDGVAQVELSGPYGELSGLDLTLADCCIALTLCQLQSVDGVRITAAGHPPREERVLRGSDVILPGAQEGAEPDSGGSALPEQ